MSERIVHICNGDSTADSLSLADLPGDIRVWADALDQGPLLAGDAATVTAARVRHLAAAMGASEADVAATLGGWDRGLDELAGAEEVVLWYEHDLFDQLALCRILYLWATRWSAGAGRVNAGEPPQLTIVSIDRHPEHPQFLGLGELSAEQLAELWPRRTPVAKEAIEEAVATWIAVTAWDPRGLPFLLKRIKALPFLAGAIERPLEEFPDPASGLSRSERQVLAAIGRGVAEERAVVREVHAIDPRYTMTDVSLARILETSLARGLITASSSSGGTIRRFAELAITARGRQALAGAFDCVAELGIDTWRGGVALRGKGPVWRWDGTGRRFVYL